MNKQNKDLRELILLIIVIISVVGLIVLLVRKTNNNSVFEPSHDNVIMRIDAIESVGFEGSVFEVSYIEIETGKKKKILVSEGHFLHDQIDQKIVKIGDKF